MIRYHSFFAGFITLVFIMLICFGACKESSERTISSLKSATISPKTEVQPIIDFIESAFQKGPQPALAISVVHGNKILFRKFNGTTKGLNGGTPVNENSIFRIGSVSKGFSGILAAMLAEKKLISLSDPIIKYIPELMLPSSEKGDSLRIWHVLSHSTGLTEHAYSNLVEVGADKDELIFYLSKLKPRDITGKDYAYQNAAFSLIEEVVSHTTQMPFTKALDAFLFKRLGMYNASADYRSIAENKLFVWPQHAGGAPRELDTAYYNTPSAGGINASLMDMEKWLAAMLGLQQSHISKTALDLAFSPRVSTSLDDKYFNFWQGISDSSYGLGWRILTLNGKKILFHGGQVSHYRTEIAFDPETQIGVVAMFSEPCFLSNHLVPEVFSRIKFQ